MESAAYVEGGGGHGETLVSINDTGNGTTLSRGNKLQYHTMCVTQSNELALLNCEMKYGIRDTE